MTTAAKVIKFVPMTLLSDKVTWAEVRDSFGTKEPMRFDTQGQCDEWIAKMYGLELQGIRYRFDSIHGLCQIKTFPVRTSA